MKRKQSSSRKTAIRAGIYLFMLVTYIKAFATPQNSACRRLSTSDIRGFTGLDLDPKIFSLDLHCHDMHKKMSVSVFFQANKIPGAGLKRTIYNFDGSNSLYLKQGATATDLDLVYNYDDSNILTEKKFPISLH